VPLPWLQFLLRCIRVLHLIYATTRNILLPKQGFLWPFFFAFSKIKENFDEEEGLLVLFDDSEKTIPPNFAENRFRIWINRHPRKQRFSYNMIFRTNPQKRESADSAVVTHHKVIILFEGIAGDLFAIYTDFSVGNYHFFRVIVIKEFNGVGIFGHVN
jgi:hypothetical protein